MSAITPTFAGEIQLAGWSESHTGGCKVTFWLQGPDELAAFRTLTTRKGNTAGHRFMAALVEIGDDELPVQADTVIPVSDKPKGGALAVLAGMWCRSPDFQTWSDTRNPAESRIFILQACEIDSRAELDHNEESAEKFHRLIRGPFSKYIQTRG